MSEELYRIFNQDCFTCLEQLINGEIIVDHIICDPPYNIELASWDKNFDFNRICKLCKQILKPSGNLILFQGWSEVCNTIEIFNKEFELKNWIIWDRIKGRGSTKNLVSTREDILWYSNNSNPIYHKMYSNIEKKTAGMGTKNGENNRALSNVWYDISPIVPWSDERASGKDCDGNGHPSQKPIELMERCISIWTNRGDTILDFTMGTGTTGRAALNLGRKFIGIEMDKKWFDVAQQRLSETTIIKDSEDIIENYDF